MTEQRLKDLLSSAYPAEPASDDRLDTIARKVRLGSNRNMRRRLAIGSCGFALLAATVGFGYPIGQAYWFSLNVTRNMAAAGPYRLIVRTLPTRVDPNVHINRFATDVYVSGQDAYLLSRAPWGTTFSHYDSTVFVRTIHSVSGVSVVRRSSADPTYFYRIPVILAEKLREFDVHKRIRDLGPRTVNGQQVEEIEMRVASTKDGSLGDGGFLLDMDPTRGVPISMRLLLGGQQVLPGLRFDYEYSPTQVRETVESFKRKEAGMRVLNLESARPAIRKQLESRPLSATRTGRDVLKVHEVEENPEGDVFVLYSCQGYHSVEDNVGDWIMLRDDSGEKWLTSIIDLQFCGLAPKGEGLKAQVFFHPRASKTTSRAHLSIRLNEWEYLPAREPSTSSTRVLDLGSFRPTRVKGVPDWYFYSFTNFDESYLSGMADVLRTRYAASSKDYAAAIQYGTDFKTRYEQDPDLLIERAEVYKALAKAYHGIGDEASAKASAAAAAKGWGE
jgi:hypothetical protein